MKIVKLSEEIYINLDNVTGIHFEAINQHGYHTSVAVTFTNGHTEYFQDIEAKNLRNYLKEKSK